MSYLFTQIYCKSFLLEDKGPYDIKLKTLGMDYLVRVGRIGTIDNVDNKDSYSRGGLLLLYSMIFMGLCFFCLFPVTVILLANYQKLKDMLLNKKSNKSNSVLTKEITNSNASFEMNHNFQSQISDNVL